jgi:hypothetical protein
MIGSTQEFLESRLPGLLQDRSELRVLFYTPNHAPFHCGDETLRDKPGLQVVLQENIFAYQAATAPFDIAFVYFEDGIIPAAVEFLESVHLREPEASLVVVTCECNGGSKFYCLRPMLERGVISDVLTTEACGGTRDLRQIFEALLENWHETITPTG